VLFSFSALLTDAIQRCLDIDQRLMWSPIEKVLYGFSSTTMAFFALCRFLCLGFGIMD
jgi:hypothetical protein